MPAGKQWRFHHWIYRGNAYIDAYQEFGEGSRFTYDALDRLAHAWTAGSDVAPYDRASPPHVTFSEMRQWGLRRSCGHW